MTIEEFVNFVANIKGCQFVNVLACTEIKMNKRNNPYYGRLKVLDRANRQINYNYENAVNNRLEKQGLNANFVSDKLPWGKWLYPNKIIVHNGEFYLRTYSVRNSNKDTKYLLDDKIATKEQIDEFKPYLKDNENDSDKQKKCGLEVEFQVKPKVFNIKNIIEISIDNMKITIEK